jgi:hypothetical protein
MSSDSDAIEYLTVDSIEWSTGHTRPRMTLEDKRAKHRVHQRHFMLRQRQRLEELHRELRCHQLQLVRLQAVQEAGVLAWENATLREQLASEPLPTGRRTFPGIWDLFPTEPESLSKSSSKGRASLSVDEDISCIFELLGMPKTEPSDVKCDDSPSLPPAKEDGLAPLSWIPTTPSINARSQAHR